MFPSVEDLPTTSTSTSPSLPPRMHHCHWDWCRLTFPTNALLVDHVIHEHVRKAQPVRRRDLPMLRRAEEGFGDSLSSGMGGISSGTGLDNTRSTFPLNSNIRPSPSSPTLSTRPTKRARIEPPSPLPSESHLESQADRLTKPRADALQPAPQTPPTSHAPSTPPGGSHSRTNARRLSAPSPNTPKRKSFAQLSSPDTSPSISGSPPLTPSFDSQIARAIRGLGAVPRIGGVKERVISRIGDRFDSDSNAESSSGTSGGSQQSVERELTQNTRSDSGSGSSSDSDSDDMGAEPEPVETSIPNPQSKKNDDTLPPPMRQAKGQMKVDTELDSTKVQNLPGDHQPQRQGTPQDALHPTSSSALSEGIVLPTQAPGYQSPSPPFHGNTPQSIGVRNHMRTQAQSQSQQTGSTKHFRSGSLKVTMSPRSKGTNLPPLSQRFVAERDRNSGGTGAGIAKRDEADDPISQATSQSQQDSQPRSQESQGSWFSSYRQPFYQLQTQAPYESQSFSQSDMSTGL